MNFPHSLARFYAWNSGQLEQNNVKTDLVRIENGKLILKESKKLDFNIQWKKGGELIAVKNNKTIGWSETGIKEEELHYLKKKSWVVIDWVQQQAERIGLQLEEIELDWSKVNEKDFMLLNPIAEKSAFTKNSQKISISDYSPQWISD